MEAGSLRLEVGSSRLEPSGQKLPGEQRLHEAWTIIRAHFAPHAPPIEDLQKNRFRPSNGPFRSLLWLVVFGQNKFIVSIVAEVVALLDINTSSKKISGDKWPVL